MLRAVGPDAPPQEMCCAAVAWQPCCPETAEEARDHQRRSFPAFPAAAVQASSCFIDRQAMLDKLELLVGEADRPDGPSGS
jgi:hypothetical protein